MIEIDRRRLLKALASYFAFSSPGLGVFLPSKSYAQQFNQVSCALNEDIRPLEKILEYNQTLPQHENGTYEKQSIPSYILQLLPIKDLDKELTPKVIPLLGLVKSEESLEDLSRVSLEDGYSYDILSKVSNTNYFTIDGFYLHRLSDLNYRNKVDYLIFSLVQHEPIKIKLVKYKGLNDVIKNKIIVWDINTKIHELQINNSNNLEYKGEITEKLKNKLGFYPSDFIGVNTNNEPLHDIVFVKKTNGMWNKYSCSNVFSNLDDFELVEPIESKRLEDKFYDDSLKLSPFISIGAFNSFNDQGNNEYLVALRPLSLPNRIFDEQTAKNLIKYNLATAEFTYFSTYFGHHGYLRWELPIRIFVDSSINKDNVEIAMRYIHLLSGINYEMISSDDEPNVMVRTIVPQDISRFGPNFTQADLAKVGGFAHLLKSKNSKLKKGIAAIKSDRASYRGDDMSLLFSYLHEFFHILISPGHVDDRPSIVSNSGLRQTTKLMQEDINMLRYGYMAPIGRSFDSQGFLP